MALQAIVDDSGRGNLPVFVLAGFAAEYERWNDFLPKWQTALDGPPKIEYFKMKEAFGLSDQFESFTVEQRDRRVSELDGELKARYKDSYVAIETCGPRVAVPLPVAHKPTRKDHNAGGKSAWMDGFFDRPTPPLWTLVGDRT